MLHINMLKLEVHTDKGPFGRVVNFKTGLNIIHGDNSTGKSTCINAILYALGIEEILGGRKEKTMKPPLREELEFEGKSVKVLQSMVYLEIENSNHEKVVVKRSIKHQTRDANLITVIFGPDLSDPKTSYDIQDMFVHLSGAAKNELGFHNFLEDFIGWHTPTVPAYSGGDKKLYIQTLFPAFFIEQKLGWSDFLATIPSYYGIRSVAKRSVEYLLNLDVLSNEKKRIEVADLKKTITANWKGTLANIDRSVKRISGKVVGISLTPEIFDRDKAMSILIREEDDSDFIPLAEVKDKIVAELIALRLAPTPKVGEYIEEHKLLLNNLQDSLNTMELQYRDTQHELYTESSNYKMLSDQLIAVEQDLVKNKDILKLIDLGSDIKLSIAEDLCPTCHQHIHDSLLPQKIHQEPMNIEENIKFLNGQRSLIELSMKTSEMLIQRYKEEVETLRREIFETRSQIRLLRRELVSDERLPSQAEIERQIKLTSKLNTIESVESEVESLFTDLSRFSDEWGVTLKLESQIPKDYFSVEDRRKLKLLQDAFREYISDFGFGSKAADLIEISEDKYYPTVNGFDMKFDASASDNIRAIWAFTLALCRVSSVEGNHPKLIIFDEPGQHQINSSHIAKFFEVLSKMNGKFQSIVATSFEEPFFDQAIREIDVHLIQINGKSIEPISE